jgi:hypothetical protein
LIILFFFLKKGKEKEKESPRNSKELRELSMLKLFCILERKLNGESEEEEHYMHI